MLQNRCNGQNTRTLRSKAELNLPRHEFYLFIKKSGTIYPAPDPVDISNCLLVTVVEL